MKADFLLEIGTEELPASALDSAMAQIVELASKMLAEAHVEHDAISASGTPRRLVLKIDKLASDQPDRTIEIKGPAKKAAFDEQGNPTKAAEGFARSQSVAVESLELRDTEQGYYVFAVREIKGRPMVELLPEILPALITGINFDKSMRWGDRDLRFSRPIRWLLALHGDQHIDFAVEDIRSDKFTYGHRFLSDNPLTVENVVGYDEVLMRGKVIVDCEERRRLIKELIEKTAAEAGANMVIHDKVFDEVVNLVENPGAFCGTFDESYLELPRDVLVTAMESHQRYFPIEADDGRLAAGFIAIHNGDPSCSDTIKKGNERVLRARLADAKFFYEEDLRDPLHKKVDDLKNVVFQEKLGTLFDKTNRVVRVAKMIADALEIKGDLKADVERAAMLLKADLVTNLVIEFPGLQGVMGREYAKSSGEKEEVAQAIYEHYLPRFADDALPQSIIGSVVSIADKLDTIAGCLTIGLLPSGSEDPYMLRRFSRGIIEIIRGNGFRISLVDLFANTVELLKEAGISPSVDDVMAEYTDFMTGRVRQYLLQEGFAYDSVDAVLAGGINDIVDTINRISGLDRFRSNEDMDSLMVGFSRCRNLSKDVEKQTIDSQLFAEDDERILYEDLSRVNIQLDDHLANEDYESAMTDLASLRPIIDSFFDRVLVMVDDPAVRDNRLNLLRYAVETFERVADFSKIVIAGT